MWQPVFFPIRQQSCWLSPQRCFFWEDKSTLILSGFQLGRFSESNEQPEHRLSLDRLQEQILAFKADRVIVIGGFQLPENNQYLEEFIQWRTRFQSLKLEFVLPRTSPVTESLLFSLGIRVELGSLADGPFVWIASRLAEEKWKAGGTLEYIINGYQDPGFKKYGAKKNEPATPAFYCTPTFALLPAFSRPHGSDAVHPGKDELVWLTKQVYLDPLH